jgi:hypothetical protein
MSATQVTHTTSDTTVETSDHTRRRADLDHDLVAILGMLAILALTVACFLGRTALPL